MVPQRQTLRAGKGAKGSILTRFIKPKQQVGDKTHRSDVLIRGEFDDEKGKRCYEFQVSTNKRFLIDS